MGGTFTYYVNGLRWSMSGGGFNRIGANTQFIEHTDTPSTYASQAGNYVTVNSAEDGLQFTAVTPGGGGAVTADEQRALNAISVQAGSTDNLIQEIDMLAGFTIVGDLGRNRQITSLGARVARTVTSGGTVQTSRTTTDGRVTSIQVPSLNANSILVDAGQSISVGDVILFTFEEDLRTSTGTSAQTILGAGTYQFTSNINAITSSSPSFNINLNEIFPVTEGIVSDIAVGPIGNNLTSGNNTPTGSVTINAPVVTTETSQQTLHVRTPSNNEFLVTDTEIEMRTSTGTLGFRFDITTGDLDIAGEVRANSTFPVPPTP